jgi:hypothetical protein
MKLNIFGWIGIIIGCLGGLVGMIVAIIAAPIEGTIFSVIFIAIFGGVFWTVLFKPMMITRRLEKNGVPATAKILKVSDTGVTVNNSPQVKLLLEVSSPLGGAYMIETKQIISRLQTALFQPGAVLPVIVDPNDKNLITIDYRDNANVTATSGSQDVNNVPVGPWAGIKKQEAESRLWEIDRMNKEIMATGVSAKAIVTKYTWLGIYVNGNNPAAEVELEVMPEDRPAFKGITKGVLMETSVPKFQPGEEILVKYDPVDITKITIEHS